MVKPIAVGFPLGNIGRLITLPCMQKKKDFSDRPPRPPREERRALQAMEGEKAMAEYLAAQRETRAKTERLRRERQALNKQ